MKRMIDVDPSIERRVDDTIKSKGFRDFQHFVTIAIENQLTWESSIDNPVIDNAEHKDMVPCSTCGFVHGDKGCEGTPINSGTAQNLRLELLKFPSKVDERQQLLPENRPPKIIWGQYYRFLPTKVGVRVLANLSRNGLPDIKFFTDSATGIALKLRPQIVRLDKASNREFGEQLSTSFPDKSDKSQKRFSSQQLIYVSRSTMKFHGMLAALKFVNIESSPTGVIKVGLTKQGWEFAMTKNPVIDDGLAQALSKEEVKFILDHIADNLPEELEHMTTALKAIEDGKQSRDELNKTLGEYYRQYHPAEMPWTDAVVNTMRAGLISRLFELGLLVRKKVGKNVSYSVSDEGRSYIAGVKYA